MAQPQPAKLDESGSQSRVPGFGNALLAIDRSAVPDRSNHSNCPLSRKSSMRPSVAIIC